jgi:hypothetical protein
MLPFSCTFPQAVLTIHASSSYFSLLLCICIVISLDVPSTSLVLHLVRISSYHNHLLCLELAKLSLILSELSKEIHFLPVDLLKSFAYSLIHLQAG